MGLSNEVASTSYGNVPQHKHRLHLYQIDGLYKQKPCFVYKGYADGLSLFSYGNH